MFQNGVSQNTKCAIKDGFYRDNHIFYTYVSFSLDSCKLMQVSLIDAILGVFLAR